MRIFVFRSLYKATTTWCITPLPNEFTFCANVYLLELPKLLSDHQIVKTSHLNFVGKIKLAFLHFWNIVTSLELKQSWNLSPYRKVWNNVSNQRNFSSLFKISVYKNVLFPPSDRKDESPKLRWKKDQTYWKKNSDNSGNEDIQLEGNLSAEYSMTTLDTLELLVQVRFMFFPVSTKVWK